MRTHWVHWTSAQLYRPPTRAFSLVPENACLRLALFEPPALVVPHYTIYQLSSTALNLFARDVPTRVVYHGWHGTVDRRAPAQAHLQRWRKKERECHRRVLASLRCYHQGFARRMYPKSYVASVSSRLETSRISISFIFKIYVRNLLLLTSESSR